MNNVKKTFPLNERQKKKGSCASILYVCSVIWPFDLQIWFYSGIVEQIFFKTSHIAFDIDIKSRYNIFNPLKYSTIYLC
jgi:hypothetical protein